ncbi:acyl-CoA N-acyltransferase [Striga asiatica]|uniref:Acyl-CoA N-acyltransferase n=1 Tax=Striga asiatica TaxID=4170 RepID=A0A5A7PCA9_STRAF|nr:acyl-CoA N-acyltransferase [Striga asiatica]
MNTCPETLGLIANRLPQKKRTRFLLSEQYSPGKPYLPRTLSDGVGGGPRRRQEENKEKQRAEASCPPSPTPSDQFRTGIRTTPPCPVRIFATAHFPFILLYDLSIFPPMGRGILKQRKRLDWQSAVPRLIPGAECCSSAVFAYLDALRSERRASDAILLRVRQHLLYSGWKIDFVLDGAVVRLRYSSPDGGYFYSLPKVCTILSQGFRPVSKRPSEKPISILLSVESGVSCPKSTELFNPVNEVIIQPEYCPEAVRDYCTQAGKRGCKPGAMKAKQHLSAIGWSFYYTLKEGFTRELRYSSPNGRVFNSLLTACKWSLGANALTFSDVIGKIGKARKNLSSVSSESGNVRRFSKKGKKRKSYSKSKTVRDIMVQSSCHYNPRTVLSWLIDSDVVLPRARVEYRGKNGLPMAEGRIGRDGIKCSCCGLIFTLSKFELHAGSSNCRPLANIFLEDGRSLMECQLELKHRMEMRRTNGVATSGETNDDVCSICGYGGRLVLCDKCPLSFHTECLGLKEVPDGDWFCPSCCCQICGFGSFEGENGQIIDCSVLTCSQCECRYHEECLRNKGTTSCYSGVSWFCEDTCEQIFCGLRDILGKPVSVGTDDMIWTLLKYIKSDPNDQYAYGEEDLLEVYGKLNVALGLMHECFEPLKEPGTGRDLVEEVIFSKGSEPNRNNFRGFYTVVLEKNDELISVATVRVHGKRVAEVPLVATRFCYRRLGMCRILMNELEKKLVQLGVERLVLPAVPSILSTWTNSFGFFVMNETDRLKLLGYTFLHFQGTVICQKILTVSPSTVSSQSTGKDVHSCYYVNGNVNFELDGNSAASEILQGEQQMEKNDLWIDELLMSA